MYTMRWKPGSQLNNNNFHWLVFHVIFVIVTFIVFNDWSLRCSSYLAVHLFHRCWIFHFSFSNILFPSVFTAWLKVLNVSPDKKFYKNRSNLSVRKLFFNSILWKNLVYSFSRYDNIYNSRQCIVQGNNLLIKFSRRNNFSQKWNTVFS